MTTEQICQEFIYNIKNTIIEIEYLLERTQNQNEIQDLLISLTIQTSRLHIINSYLPFKKQIHINHSLIIDHLNKLDSPQDLLSISYLSMKNIEKELHKKEKHMQHIPNFKYTFAYIIKALLDLKFVEYYIIRKEEMKYESIVLESLKKAKELNSRRKNRLFEYMILWSEGLYNLFLSLMTNKISVKNMLLERSQLKLLKSYNQFLTSDPKREKFPITDDPLFDISPFYIGATFLQNNKIDVAKSFFNIAIEEGTIPSYYYDMKIERHKMTTMEFLMESKLQSTLLVSTMQSINNIGKEAEVPDAKERLRRRLELYGFKEKEVPGDGNCQMSSLSYQLFETFDHADDIRKCIVNWLRENKELEIPENGAKLKDFVYEDWDVYCNQMEKSGTWGDHLTLIAAAEVFNCTIVIFSSMPGNDYITEIVPFKGENENGKTLFLSHYAEFHFTTLIKLE